MNPCWKAIRFFWYENSSWLNHTHYEMAEKRGCWKSGDELPLTHLNRTKSSLKVDWIFHTSINWHKYSYSSEKKNDWKQIDDKKKTHIFIWEKCRDYYRQLSHEHHYIGRVLLLPNSIWLRHFLSVRRHLLTTSIEWANEQMKRAREKNNHHISISSTLCAVCIQFSGPMFWFIYRMWLFIVGCYLIRYTQYPWLNCFNV